MIIRQTALAATLLFAATAHAELPSWLKLSGFGTIAFTHSGEKNADYVGNRFQPNGAGHTRSTDFGPDSKIGAQLSAQFNDQWSGVLQVVSQHQYDNSYKPMVEWANIKYQVAPELSVRAGRIALPSYLISESRFVGYANTWAHVPTEVYSVLSLTSGDGIDLTHRKSFGDINNTFQAFFGTAKANLPLEVKAKSKPTWGLNDSVEFGSWTLRAGYSSYDIDLDGPSISGLFAGLDAIAANAGAVLLPEFQLAAQQAAGLSKKYSTKGIKVSALSLGLNYDPGEWFVMSEFVAFQGEGLFTNSKSWYGTVGYRLGAFTPYFSYASTKADVRNEAGITSLTGSPLDDAAAVINGGLNTSLNSVNGSQATTSVGIRWDAMSNVAVKAQYDRIKLGSNSAGRLTNLQPGFKSGGNVDLFSVSVDFVF